MAIEEPHIEMPTLPLGFIDEPFKLTAQETLFMPDDWAWQFLRINSDYRKAYNSAVEKYAAAINCTHPNLFDLAPKHQHQTIRIDEVKCRDQFGLATWLDPKMQLPKLDSGESWFFPLMKSRSRPEDGLLPASKSGIFSEQSLVSTGPDNRGKFNERNQLFSTPYVWFAIDCSVPPLAQLKSVEVVSIMRRDWLRFRDAKMRTHLNDDPIILPMDGCKWFMPSLLPLPFGASDKTTPGSLWVAIRIDVLGEVKTQMKSYANELTKKYLALCKTSAIRTPVLQKFKNGFSDPVDEAGHVLSDGHFLKERVVCAHLAGQGLSPDQIIEFIEESAIPLPEVVPKPMPNSVADKWMLGHKNRIAIYCRSGMEFVNGGYRWLVHAQKR